MNHLARILLGAMLGLAAVMAFAPERSLAAVYKWEDDQGGWHFTDSPSKIPKQYRKAIPKPRRRARVSPEIPKESLHVPIPGTVPIIVSIIKSGFTPTLMKVPATWNKPVRTVEERPKSIRAVPQFKYKTQIYGSIQLGTARDNTYHFILSYDKDAIKDTSPVLYFDMNKNGDLSDDGGPITNEGNGIFAASIKLPFKQVLPGMDIPGDYEIWFFTNKSLWKTSRMAFYSRTQLAGFALLKKRPIPVILADRGLNDADFTNDGINIDLDGDGKIDRKKEYFPPGKAAVIDDIKYEFIVKWK